MFNKFNLFDFIIFTILFCTASFNVNISKNMNSFSNKKNLIIGLAFRYPWNKIRNFFISFKKAEFKNCDIAIFVRELSKKTLKKIKSCGAIIYKVPKVTKIPAFIYRWELYKDFLIKNKDNYNIVFTADIRDTIFQKDIFKFYNYNTSFFGLFLEDVILNTKINKNWLLFLMDKKEFQNKLANKRVICAGTIIGTIDKFIEFSNVLWDTVKDNKNLNKIIDQGVLNFLIYYKNLFNDSIIIKDNNGPLMTIGATPIDKIFLDNDNNILNFNKQIAAVVHQYDRKKDITEKMNIKYDDSKFNFSSYIQINTSEINKFNYLIHQKWSQREDNNNLFIIIIIILFLLIMKKSHLVKENEMFKKNKRSG